MTIGSVFILGWIAVASIWTDFEIILPNRDTILLPQWCPQSVLSGPTVFGNVFDNGLAITKDTLAWVLMASYAVYLVSAGIAWWKERKAEKCDGRELGMELESL